MLPGGSVQGVLTSVPIQGVGWCVDTKVLPDVSVQGVDWCVNTKVLPGVSVQDVC